MNRRAFRTIVLLASVSGLLCVSGLTAFGQGLYWESQTTQSGQTKASASKNWMVAKKLKVESDDSTVIARLDKETMILVQPKDKTYSEMTFEELEATTKGAQAAADAQTAEMEKMLQGLPPDQRAAVEKAMGQSMKRKAPGKAKESPVVVTSTGETKKILGYTCTKHVAKQDGKEILSAWATKDIEGFQSLRKDYEAFARRMARLSPTGAAVSEAYMKIDGMALESDMGGIKTVVTKIEKRAVEDKEFEVPAGFTKTASPLAGFGATPAPKVPASPKVPPRLKAPGRE